MYDDNIMKTLFFRGSMVITLGITGKKNYLNCENR